MKPPLSYREAGVDIAAADGFVERIAKLARTTFTGGEVPYTNQYASLFRLPLAGLEDPLLAVTCDGVGTKLLVARAMKQFEGLGQDLVAMNVNDLVPVGAKPLVFLDYLATGKLEPRDSESVIVGMVKACRAVGCALIGGETAEMPGVYEPGELDLAGFAAGIVDGARLPDRDAMRDGDVVLGLPSSGVHSNGLSLARAALLERGGVKLDDMPSELHGRSVGEELLVPTALYVNEALELMARFRVRAAAHVTGGGLLGRGRKMLAPGLRLVLHPERFSVPAIFGLIARVGGVPKREMLTTFNMGLGFLVVLSPQDANEARQTLRAPWIQVGTIRAGNSGVEFGDVHSD